MDNKENLMSYQEVESVQLNLPDNEFNKYCELKLLSAEDDKAFIREHVYKGTPMDVCEIGCGNGKLLLSMELDSMISQAVGYEVSETRCKFADRFLNRYDSKKVQIINHNFLDVYENVNQYDLIILVDIVWLIISPLYDKAEQDAMEWIYNHLREGGMVLFEMEDYSRQIERIKREGAYLFWEEFPKDDPFKYGLYKMDLDKDKNVVDGKLFLRRDGMKEEAFKNVIKSYTRAESIELLEKYGFNADIYPYYKCDGGSVRRHNEHDLYRVLARK